MIDLFDLPVNVDRKTFYVDGTVWQTWTKPKAGSMAHILCIGAGGAGDYGWVGSPANNSYFGGAGGGGAAVTIATVPFYLIPDVLYIQIGLGGYGPTNGGSGTRSFVSLFPSTDMADCLVVNSLGTANSGAGNQQFQNNASGALGANATNNPRYLSLCNWASYGSTAGIGGGGPFGAGNITMCANTITCGGSGGGGGYPQGPAVLVGPGLVVSPDPLASFFMNLTMTQSSFSNLPGPNGYTSLKPFFNTGAVGGGQSNVNYPSGGNANFGGTGAFGSGGGGGGIVNSGLATPGGPGGDGLVIITSY